MFFGYSPKDPPCRRSPFRGRKVSLTDPFFHSIQIEVPPHQVLGYPSPFRRFLLRAICLPFLQTLPLQSRIEKPPLFGNSSFLDLLFPSCYLVWSPLHPSLKVDMFFFSYFFFCASPSPFPVLTPPLMFLVSPPTRSQLPLA